MSIIASYQPKLKKLFQIRSDSFGNAEQALAIKTGERHCCFSITDLSGERLSQVAYYSVAEMNENSLIDLFADHPELNNSFSKVMICYDYPQALVVPKNFFKPEESFAVLKLMYGFKGRPVVAAQSILNKDLNIVYVISNEVSEWLNKKFPSASFFHNYSVPIQNINSDKDFSIDFRTDEFSLIVTKENKLLLAQTFFYSSPDDVIYYLLKAAIQFSLYPKKIKLFLSGLIEKESALFKELYQYFLNIEFRNTTWQTDENEYPSHFFTSLNDLIQCAS